MIVWNEMPYVALLTKTFTPTPPEACPTVLTQQPQEEQTHHIYGVRLMGYSKVYGPI